MTSTQHQVVAETRIVMADPTALGVFGLAMVTFVAASQKLGLTSGSAYIVPWAMFLGSAAQIWASTVDFKKNNYFGATVLGAYGLFWMAVSMHWAIGQGWLGTVDPAKADPTQLAYACFGYFIFSIFIMIASFETNKVFTAILVLINVLLPSLGLAILKIEPAIFSPLAAWSELGISLLGFYAAGAKISGLILRTTKPRDGSRMLISTRMAAKTLLASKDAIMMKIEKKK